jgi:polar amino acid transport system substrate-binding protein
MTPAFIKISGLVCFLLLTVYQAEADVLLSAGDSARFATSTVKPWGFMDEQGQQRGMLVEFAEQLSHETGTKYQNYLQPYPRVIHSLGSGFVDFAVLLDGPLAEKSGIRVGGLFVTEVLIVAKAGIEPLNSIEQLAGMRVGHIRGSNYGDRFDNASHFKRLPINTMRQGLAMVLAGRIDAMASADFTLYYGMEKMELKAEQLSRLLVVREHTGGLYMSRQSRLQHLMPVYREAIERMKIQGNLAQIFYKPQIWAPVDGSLDE